MKLLLVALSASVAAMLPSIWGHTLANGDSVEISRGRQGAYEIIVGVH